MSYLLNLEVKTNLWSRLDASAIFQDQFCKRCQQLFRKVVLSILSMYVCICTIEIINYYLLHVPRGFTRTVLNNDNDKNVAYA